MNRHGIRVPMRHIETGEVKVAFIFKLERVLGSTDGRESVPDVCQIRFRLWRYIGEQCGARALRQ